MLRRKWVSDSVAFRCYLCHCTFTWFNRKHHCRRCGKIFCGSCCPVRDVRLDELPRCAQSTAVLSKSPETWGKSALQMLMKNRKRYCRTCLKVFCELAQCKTLINVLYALCKQQLCDISDLTNLSRLSKSYHRSASELLGRIAAVPHMLPTQALSDLDVDLLRCNQRLLQRHGCFLYALSTLPGARPPPQPGPSTLEQAWELLLYSDSLRHKEYAMNVLRNASEEEMSLFILPLLCVEDSVARRSLYSLLDFPTKFQVFWLARALFPEDGEDEAEALLDCDTALEMEIEHATYLFRTLQKLADSDEMKRYTVCKRFEAYTDKHQFARIPGMFDLKVVKLLPTTLKTASKHSPVILTAVCLLPDGSREQRRIMLKKDVCIADAFTLHTCTYLREKVLAEEFREDFVTFRVTPVQSYPPFSLVEVVDDCLSLSAITRKHGCLNDYLLQRNPHQTIARLQTRFMRSLAVSTIVSYVLAFGDRHAGNLLVTSSGTIFHCDLNCVLGKEAGMRKQVPSKLKITSDMLKWLGGKSSLNFQRFKVICTTLYNVVRAHTRSLNLFLHLPFTRLLPGYITSEAYHSLVYDVLCPGDEACSANVQILDKLEFSSSSTATSQENILDKMHEYISQLKKIYQQ